MVFTTYMSALKEVRLRKDRLYTSEGGVERVKEHHSSQIYEMRLINTYVFRKLFNAIFPDRA
jgi:hypothetical protein